MITWIIAAILAMGSSQHTNVTHCYDHALIYAYESTQFVNVWDGETGEFLYSTYVTRIDYTVMDYQGVDYSCITYNWDNVIITTRYTLDNQWYGIDTNIMIAGQKRMPYTTVKHHVQIWN